MTPQHLGRGWTSGWHALEGQLGRGQGTELAVGHSLGFFSDPLLPLSPLPTPNSGASLLLTALPLLHVGNKREEGFFLCFLLALLLPHGCPVYDTIQPQFQPGVWRLQGEAQTLPSHQQFLHLKDV